MLNLIHHIIIGIAIKTIHKGKKKGDRQDLILDWFKINNAVKKGDENI